ncbi:Heat-labile enterotoxin IIA, A chain [Metarhizium album ARSEF 1941]|uniref:Heat-labile enterotoxin IIA, A chain n=1 Tax=Metarhizium album (strain ARSEF 1941) TaxID=1081103 RepID=A0A0B2X075_METAS|nr:Heat-labile enterotoxin IIA, A chain [Metarhizium album ARSEF 1941]KHO01927.1 Heat-labile enterotoxin IIA, A chain [Metarhizium album ARSEF 1941]
MDMSLRAAITLLLFFQPCQSQPEPGCGVEAALNRCQVPLREPGLLQSTYRGETGRTPEDVQKAGGFYSRGLQRQLAGAELTDQELRDGSSLFKHAEGYTAQYTRYVSTSADPAAALRFAVAMGEEADQRGFLYKIHADGRMIDVDGSLRRHSPYLALRQREHAAIGFIPFAQIEGWWEITVNLDEKGFDGRRFLYKTGKKLRQGRLKDFHKNLEFDEKTFARLQGHGAAPELAGFPQGHRAWKETTWKEFEKQPVEIKLDELISAICAPKDKLTKRNRTSCLWPLADAKAGKPNIPKAPDVHRVPHVPHGSRKGGLAQNRGKGPLRKLNKISITKMGAGSTAAFHILAPYARDVLEAVKKWDHPVGRAVGWFDDTITSFQESLFGKRVPEIDGNETKLRLLCWLRGEQNDEERGVGKACKRLRATDKNEQQQDDWVLGLNQLSALCYAVETDPPEEESIRLQLETSCAALQVELEREEKSGSNTGKTYEAMHKYVDQLLLEVGWRFELRQVAEPEPEPARGGRIRGEATSHGTTIKNDSSNLQEQAAA